MTDPDGSGDAQPQGERDDRPELDIDSAFAAIVAGFSDPVPHGVGPWPASEDLDDPADDLSGGGADRRGADGPDADGRGADRPGADGPRADGTVEGDPARAERGVDPGPVPTSPVGGWDPPLRRISVPAEPVRPDSATSRPEPPDAGDDEEGYVPPEPPPFPRGDLVSRLAWAGVIGGPLFLLLAALTWRSLPTIMLLVALTAFVGGFVTLVARMPQDHPDDPDDGAIV